MLNSKFSITRYNFVLDRIETSFSFEENPTNFYIMQLRPSGAGAARQQYFYELSVPTCSYRMGMPEMGYGMLSISK